MMIQLVSIEVPSQIFDSCCEKGNLHRSAPTIAVVKLMLLYDRILVDRHMCLRRSLRCKGSDVLPPSSSVSPKR